MKNRMALVFALLLGFIASIAAVNAEFKINKVQVDDFDISGNRLNVERGDEIVLEAWVSCDDNSTLTSDLHDDVRVRARIDGYEFGSIEDITPVFECAEGNLYKKTLALLLPIDLDASENYTLRIEVFDKLERTESVYDLFVNEPRHFVNIFDIFTSPVSNVKAGSPLFVTVRVENLGQKSQDNVKVTASIPELGVTAIGYTKDDLITELQEEAQRFDDEEEDTDVVTLMLRVPDDAPTGNYNIDVVVEYNRGHDFATGSKSMFVQGAEQPVKKADALINVDSSSKDLSAEQETVYKLMFANIGGETGLYSVQVDGEDLWGTARVEPGFLSLEGGRTGEVSVFVKAKPDAKAGNYNFVARVLSGTSVVREINLNARVPETVKAVDAKTVLAVIFVVLIVVLIILAIILAAQKAGAGRKPGEESSVKTYY